MTDNPTRRLESLRQRSAEIADRLARLRGEIDDAVAGDDDALLAVLLAERGALEAKASSIARSIAGAKGALTQEGRAERREQIAAVETLVLGTLEADALDATEIEALLDLIVARLESMHDRGAKARAALAPLLPRTVEGGRRDRLVLDDLSHASGMLGRMLRSAMLERGLFTQLAVSPDPWPNRASEQTLSEVYRVRVATRGRRVSAAVADALAGV